MTRSVQATAAAIEWRRMADQDTYYALRDGPRLYRANWAIDKLAKYLPDDHVALAKRLCALHARTHASGSSEIRERVQGGIGPASYHERTRRLAARIKQMAGFEAVALGVGKDGYWCLRGICEGDTQAELMRRVRYPLGSNRTLKRLVQVTLIALAKHAEQHPLDECSRLEQEFVR